MDVNAFTHKAQEALAGAERLALGSDHQRVQPEHLLAALMSDPEGIVFPLVRRAGADPGALKARAGEALSRIPKVYGPEQDRKSTRLNSSHVEISYAVFCLKKKKTKR